MGNILKNKGSVGLHIADEDNEFKIIANVTAMTARLLGVDVGDEEIVLGLEKSGIEASRENIMKVRELL